MPTASGVYQIFSVTWCATAGVAACTLSTIKTLSIEISQGFKNPANARFASNSIKLEAYTSSGDKIDAVTSNVITIPSCNYGALQSADVTRSVQTVGQATKLTFTFKTAAIPAGALIDRQGFVNILFPAGFLFKTGTANPVCTVKDASQTAAITTNC